MTFPPDFGFYGILTDPVVGYERLAELMCQRGIHFIQLRIKDRPADEVLDVARRVRRVVAPPSLFIVNDDPGVALASGADGVHLGQDDMPYARARDIVGPGAIIGLSTHDVGQTRAACALRPDYIGIGPVWPTPAKKNPDPAIGLRGMATMIAEATVPAVVLGSIDHDNVADVVAAGADNVCAVRAINQAADPGEALDRMLATILEARRSRILAAQQAERAPLPVVACAVRCDGQLLVLRRRYAPGAGKWGLPAGYVEPGETAEEAMSREIREETGLDVAVRLCTSWQRIDARGRAFLGLFPVADATTRDVTLDHENLEYRWIPLTSDAIASLDWAFEPHRIAALHIVEGTWK